MLSVCFFSFFFIRKFVNTRAYEMNIVEAKRLKKNSGKNLSFLFFLLWQMLQRMCVSKNLRDNKEPRQGSTSGHVTNCLGKKYGKQSKVISCLRVLH